LEFYINALAMAYFRNFLRNHYRRR